MGKTRFLSTFCDIAWSCMYHRSQSFESFVAGLRSTCNSKIKYRLRKQAEFASCEIRCRIADVGMKECIIWWNAEHFRPFSLRSCNVLRAAVNMWDNWKGWLYDKFLHWMTPIYASDWQWTFCQSDLCEWAEKNRMNSEDTISRSSFVRGVATFVLQCVREEKSSGYGDGRWRKSAAATGRHRWKGAPPLLLMGEFRNAPKWKGIAVQSVHFKWPVLIIYILPWHGMRRNMIVLCCLFFKDAHLIGVLSQLLACTTHKRYSTGIPSIACRSHPHPSTQHARGASNRQQSVSRFCCHSLSWLQTKIIIYRGFTQ